MRPRFVGRLGIADAVTAANAGIGFTAVFATTINPQLAARFVLLAAIADGLDGLLARRYGSTPVGDHLDSLADVTSFSVAPALIAVTLAINAWGFTGIYGIIAVGIGALFVVSGVIRLGIYTAYDTGNAHTEGVPTTLAATVLTAGVLAGVSAPAVLIVSTGILTVLMGTTVTYPDLYARDALAMGVVQVGAVLVPFVFWRVFPRVLLVFALAYLVLAPWLYWRSEGKRS